MDRYEYMKELEELLHDISSEERDDALAYYNDYFDAGGEENEQATIESLGEPEALARTIKLASGDTVIEDGEFTETGYSSESVDGNAVMNRTEVAKRGSINLSTGTLILLIIGCVFALPIIGPVVLGILGGLVGCFAAFVGVVVAVACAFFAVGIACGLGGIVGIIYGVGSLFTAGMPAGSLLIIGVSSISLAIGIGVFTLAVWIATKLIPPAFRAVVDGCKSFIAWFKKMLTRNRQEADLDDLK